jgi:hypothetical protein
VRERAVSSAGFQIFFQCPKGERGECGHVVGDLVKYGLDLEEVAAEHGRGDPELVADIQEICALSRGS